MLSTLQADERWLQNLAEAQPAAAIVLSSSASEQKSRGYFHTSHEICQQPSTWPRTAEQMVAASEGLRASLIGIESLILTGSGSSEFAGDCVCEPLRRELGMAAEVVGGGTLLACTARSNRDSRRQLE